jgi:predicted nucleic acid-binding protein
VAGKWYLRDEQCIQEATQLLQDFQDERIVLIAPDHIRYEVPSLIRNAIARARISPTQARRAIELFLSLDLHTVRSSSLILLGYDEALTYQCSIYDGLYVALSRLARVSLVHADDRLRRALKGTFPHELWVEDYRTPS